MSRDITAPAIAAIDASNLALVVFVEMDFSSGFLRANNSGQNFDWNGYTWIGVGSLGSIDSVQEVSDLSAQGLSFSMSGVPTEYISNALGADYQGRSCRLWFAALDSNHAVIADPIGPFNYRMDTMDIELGQTATIKVQAESRLIDWERADVSRYTNEEQQRLYPGDLGLEFVPQMAEKQIKWGYQ